MSARRGRFRIWAALVVAAITGGIAHGQPVPAEDGPPRAKTPAAAPSIALDAREAYNAGCRALKGGDYARALDLFRQADAASDRPRLSADARYNAGHAAFKQALSLLQTSPDQAIELLRTSAAAYRASLDLTPGDPDAARSLEAARRALARLLDEKKQREEKKKEQQKQEQQQRQQAADALDELADRQQDLSDRAAELAEKDPQDPQSQKEGEDLAKEQDALNESTRQAREELASQGDDPRAAEARQRLEKAEQEQKSAADALDRREPTPASKSAASAANELRQAAQALRKADEPAEQEGQPKPQEPGRPQESDQPQAQEPNDPEQDLVQAILDREERQRAAREAARRARMRPAPPVEKDW